MHCPTIRTYNYQQTTNDHAQRGLRGGRIANPDSKFRNPQFTYHHRTSKTLPTRSDLVAIVASLQSINTDKAREVADKLNTFAQKTCHIYVRGAAELLVHGASAHNHKDRPEIVAEIRHRETLTKAYSKYTTIDLVKWNMGETMGSLGTQLYFNSERIPISPKHQDLGKQITNAADTISGAVWGNDGLSWPNTNQPNALVQLRNKLHAMVNTGAIETLDFAHMCQDIEHSKPSTAEIGWPWKDLSICIRDAYKVFDQVIRQAYIADDLILQDQIGRAITSLTQFRQNYVAPFLTPLQLQNLR